MAPGWWRTRTSSPRASSTSRTCSRRPTSGPGEMAAISRLPSMWSGRSRRRSTAPTSSRSASGGRIHNKGFAIVNGYLHGKYAQERPLALSASISFEQTYDEVEGDSAAAAELYALLSALAEAPIKQGIAVTGSVNQRGEIQPIGGVNEKIEGFYAVCKAKGLTSEQGVVIPKANVRNLMLRQEVLGAVRDGRFHVWAVAQVDGGI